MNLKKILNLNSYEWWRNHRKVVTYGLFLLAFCIYLNPFIKEIRFKNKCISIAYDRFLEEAPNNEKISRDSSFVLAYQICNHRAQ